MTGSDAVYWPSPQQKLIWSQGGAAWNAIALTPLEGPVHEERMRAALEALVARHEVLRTVFRARAGMKIPFQVVLESAPPSWEAGPGDPELAFQEQASHKFDLERGPVVHGALVKGEGSCGALVLVIPALLCDRDSLGVLNGGLQACSCRFCWPGTHPGWNLPAGRPGAELVIAQSDIEVKYNHCI